MCICVCFISLFLCLFLIFYHTFLICALLPISFFRKAILFHFSFYNGLLGCLLWILLLKNARIRVQNPSACFVLRFFLLFFNFYCFAYILWSHTNINRIFKCYVATLLVKIQYFFAFMMKKRFLCNFRFVYWSIPLRIYTFLSLFSEE